eukprot:9281321-Pyramimonas_sp.AAC.1
MPSTEHRHGQHKHENCRRQPPEMNAGLTGYMSRRTISVAKPADTGDSVESNSGAQQNRCAILCSKHPPLCRTPWVAL